ncbi:hypothetical protein FOZ62_019220 [Perkinsus olseni]|uniref:Uncharacterized protein n=1 Tax=Perkinsus olseni TaxID=32597 RepID=A0A7J6TL79_PEROL|nr:hypothetical protein FOZ62_019220 [Perkinsus olseni]
MMTIDDSESVTLVECPREEQEEAFYKEFSLGLVYSARPEFDDRSLERSGSVESLAVGMQGTASDALDLDQQNVGLTMAKLLSKRFAPLQVVVSFNLVDAEDELVNAVQREIIAEVKCRDTWGALAESRSAARENVSE